MNTNLSFLLFLGLLFLIPLLINSAYFRKILFEFKGTGIKLTYRIDQIPPEFGKRDFIDCSAGELYGVTGEGHPMVFNDETLEALRAAHSRGVKMSFIGGPVQIQDDILNTAPLVQLAKEGVIDLYYSEKRQKEHFWVSKNGMVFSEDIHEPVAEIRTGYYIKNNCFESDDFIKKFKEALHGKNIKVIRYHNDMKPFIVLSMTEFKRAKSIIKCGEKQPYDQGIMAFEYCCGETLENALRSSGISFTKS